MAKRPGQTYRQAGVNLSAADEAVDRIAPLVRRTFGPRVLPTFGGFAGALRLDYDEKLFARNYRDPIVLLTTDGVGSKLLIAIDANRFDTIGIDLVAMSVNDLLACGAEPLAFLDYIAIHQLKPRLVEQLVAGMVAGCADAGCALLGGETAEMPALYRPGHFDLAGFAMGVVERKRMIPSGAVQPGDEIIGLPSSGVHSNGYALVRRVLLENAELPLDQSVRALGEPLVDALLRPTRIYVRPVLELLRSYRGRPPITGMAHITGSGLPGNLPRALADTCDAVLRVGSWPVPPIFGLIEHHGVDETEMYQVFNMGIGFAIFVRPRSTATVLRRLEKAGEQPVVIGKVRRGRGQVVFR